MRVIKAYCSLKTDALCQIEKCVSYQFYSIYYTGRARVH